MLQPRSMIWKPGSRTAEHIGSWYHAPTAWTIRSAATIVKLQVKWSRKEGNASARWLCALPAALVTN